MATVAIHALDPHCRRPLLSSEDDLPPPLQCSRKKLQLFRFRSQLQAPISENDVETLLPMFCEEEIQALCALQQAASPRLRFARSRSVDDQAGGKRKSRPWSSCISDDEVTSPPTPTPPPIKRARSKNRSRREDAAIRRMLREWHNEIATLILRRQFNRAPELSHGRTALGCQCHELAQDDGALSGCALHQDGQEPGHRAWMYSAQGRVPLVGGPGEVLVPTMSAGNSKATVLQYQRWRRGVQMPSRFYVERAAQQGIAAAAAAAAERRAAAEDDWMMMD